ncbi:UNVERIFIED_CONTAM: hypothetical protein K2H54_042530 [Gekko kuhli]
MRGVCDVFQKLHWGGRQNVWRNTATLSASFPTIVWQHHWRNSKRVSLTEERQLQKKPLKNLFAFFSFHLGLWKFLLLTVKDSSFSVQKGKRNLGKGKPDFLGGAVVLKRYLV